MAKNSNDSFAKGALILVIANVLVKIIGAVFKIPLARLLGEEGMGLFSASYTMYSFMFIIATAGLPVAISKLVSEAKETDRGNQAKKILRISMVILGVVGVFGTSALYFGADFFASKIGAPRAAYGIRSIAPAMFFVSLMSAYRGYFQGRQNMLPTAISEVIEALGKLLIGYALAAYFMNTIEDEITRLNLGAAGAVLGVAIGAALAFVFLFGYYAKNKKKLYSGTLSDKPDSSKSIAGNIIKIAIPVTVGASVFSLTSLIDMAMIMRRLQVAGFSEAMALQKYGSYTGFAIPMFNLPPTLISSISISVVPAIAAAFAAKRVEEAEDTIRIALKITTLFALPCAVGMAILAEPILGLVYSNTGATETLSVLGYAIVFVSLVMVSNAILQAMGKVYVPVIHMIAGGVAKVIINYFLVAIPAVNIAGAPIGTNVCYIIILVLNIISIKKYSSVKLRLPEFVLKPLVCVVSMAAAVIALYNVMTPLGMTISTVLAIGAGAVVYFVMIVITKSINYKDLLMLPKGEKIADLMLRKNLIKK